MSELDMDIHVILDLILFCSYTFCTTSQVSAHGSQSENQFDTIIKNPT